MPDSVLTALVNAGVLGPILVIVALAYLRLQKDCKQSIEELQQRLDGVQEKRTHDAQAVVQQILTIAEETNATNQALVLSIRENTIALQELRESVREIRPSGRRI